MGKRYYMNPVNSTEETTIMVLIRKLGKSSEIFKTY